MAPRKPVRPLKDLCLPIVVTLMKTIVDDHCQRKKFKRNKMTKALKIFINDVPPNLHDLLFNLHLQRVIEMFGRRDFRGEKKYFNRLMFVSDILKVKSLTISDKPAYMRRKLLHLLSRMRSLEVFSCPEHWTSELEPGGINKYRFSEYGNLLKALPTLSNLTSFTFREFCTDKIIRSICRNCKSLRIIDVEGCKSDPTRITDVSVQSLIKCKSLESVNLLHTAVSPDGFLKLLERKSSGLLKICGLEKCLYEVLDKLEGRNIVCKVREPATKKMGTKSKTKTKIESKTGTKTGDSPLATCTFQLQELKCANPTEKHLRLVVKYFPLLTKLLFAHESSALHRDFSVLSELKRLERVELEFDNCGPFDVPEILSKCPSVVSVSLCHKNVLIMGSWLYSVSELCPNIEKLTVCEPSKCCADPEFMPRLECAPKSFQNLTELVWIEPTVPCAQRILCQAKHVQTLKIFCPVNLADEIFEYVFVCNPLGELKKLTIDHTPFYPCNISRNMLKRIVTTCERLTLFSLTLPYLFDFRDSMNPENREYCCQVRDWIAENNYDVTFEIGEGDTRYV